MKYLIQSVIDQKILDANDKDCFLSCKNQKDQNSDWVFIQCPEGKGWCCSLIENSKNYKLVVPSKIKKQCVRTYFHGFVDAAEMLHKSISTMENDQINNLVEKQTSISDIVVHNSKNIHTNIVSKIQGIFPNINDDYYDKIEYIRNEIQLESKSQDIAREILSVWKSLSQQSFQYSVADYIDAKKLNLVDFGIHRIFTIIRMSYFQYEDDFLERKIKLKINPYEGDICCHFDTVKASFCALFENCIKYCRPDTSIDISFEEKNGMVIVAVSMESRVIDSNDIPKIFEYANRGRYVNDLPGKGIGLWMMKKMLQLNYGQVSVTPSTNIYSFNGSHYGNNVFKIELNLNKSRIREYLAK